MAQREKGLHSSDDEEERRVFIGGGIESTTNKTSRAIPKNRKRIFFDGMWSVGYYLSLILAIGIDYKLLRRDLGVSFLTVTRSHDCSLIRHAAR